MISLFRKIRQKLLQDLPTGQAGNKVTRYLAYAIGEIFLVVIGILIALQVNTWNEKRIAMVNEKVLLTEVLEAVRADSVELDVMAAIMDSTFNMYAQLYMIANNELSPDSLRNIDLMRNSANNRPISKGNYPDLASKVMDANLKKRLFEYYRLLSIWEYVIEEYNRFIEDKMRPFLGEQKFLVYGSQHKGDIRLGKIETAIVINKLNEPEVQQMLFEATQKTRNYLGMYDELVLERGNLVAEIKRVIR
jgi:hypothetical protein